MTISIDIAAVQKKFVFRMLWLYIDVIHQDLYKRRQFRFVLVIRQRSDLRNEMIHPFSLGMRAPLINSLGKYWTDLVHSFCIPKV